MVQDGDLVHPEDRFWPVGDHQNGAAPNQGGEGFLDFGLGFGVGERGCLIQDEDGGIHKQSAGDSDALLFAAGQVNPAAEHGVETVGESVDSVGDAGGHRGGPHLRVGGVRAAQGNIVPDRHAQQLRVLEHKPNVSVQLPGGNVPQINAPERDRPGIRVVEAGQQGGEGRLSRPGRPHQGSHGAFRKGERHVPQRLGVVVGEGHLVEHHLGTVNILLRLGFLLQDGGFQGSCHPQRRCPGNLVGPGGITEQLNAVGQC